MSGARGLASRFVATVAVLLRVLAAGPDAHADPVEPPPEADPASDYATEPHDSLATDTIGWSYGLMGTPGHASRRRRSVTFRGDSLDVTLRDGDGEPYAGGDVGVRAAGRELQVGRLAPRWGLGLVVGAAPQPWDTRGGFASAVPGVRARSGEGVGWTRGSLGLQVFAGRFGKRPMGGVAWARGRWQLGLLGSRERALQVSLATAADERAAEIAVDRAGGWRGEAFARHTEGDDALTWRARLGSQRFVSLAEPRRAGAPRALGAFWTRVRHSMRTGISVAAWRFGPEAAGARASAELTWRSPGGAVTTGVEERHGPSRPPTAPAASPTGMRQGAWVEWRGGSPALGLAVRHEVWGRAAFARAGTRRAFGATVASRWRGIAIECAHSVYRVESGEALFVAESDADRWILRALSGAGARSRLGARVKTAQGTVEAAVGATTSRGRTRSQWSLRWSRSVRVRR